MPKAILKFDLPEEQEEFELALNATNWEAVVFQLQQYLRSQLKYNSDNLTEKQFNVYSEVNEKLFSLLDERGLEL